MSEEKKIYYYAQINTDSKLCCGVSQLCGEKIQDNMIELESYDMSLMGKMWTGTWNEETQSWEDIMDKLNDMSGDQVSVATLDAAYREGVNSYAG